MGYRCATCGEEHDGPPDVGFRWPDPYFDVPESERAARIRGDSDLCAIDGEFYFVRAVLLVPIRGTDEHLGIGAWVSQSKQSFDTYIANYDTSEIGPFFGWFGNRISFYEPTTYALKAMVHFQGNGQRPLIQLEQCDHPLYRDWAEGISIERAWEVVHWRSA